MSRQGFNPWLHPSLLWLHFHFNFSVFKKIQGITYLCVCLKVANMQHIKHKHHHYCNTWTGMQMILEVCAVIKASATGTWRWMTNKCDYCLYSMKSSSCITRMFPKGPRPMRNMETLWICMSKLWEDVDVSGASWDCADYIIRKLIWSRAIYVNPYSAYQTSLSHGTLSLL